MKKVLITGAAGFIGTHLTRHLVENTDFEVIALDDLSGGFEDNVPKGATFIKGSITDENLINQLFEKYRFNYVYHLAAYAAEGLSHFIRRFNYNNNLIGSINLINGAVNYGTECFVFTSSIAVYGAGQLPMSEEMVPQPEDPYGVAKYAVELDLKAAHEMFGLKYVIFRPHNVYGEFQNIGDKYRNVVGIFINQVLQGKPLSIFGDGQQKRAFSYVGDFIPLMARSAWAKDGYNEVFNIGADTPYSVNQLAETVRSVMKVHDHPVIHNEARNEVVEAYSDHSKVRKVYGDYPITSLAEGIDKMVKWVLKVGPRQSKFFEQIEIEKMMPAAWRKK
jgi:UDP-glucose 4-epimerase